MVSIVDQTCDLVCSILGAKDGELSLTPDHPIPPKTRPQFQQQQQPALPLAVLFELSNAGRMAGWAGKLEQQQRQRQPDVHVLAARRLGPAFSEVLVLQEVAVLACDFLFRLI